MDNGIHQITSINDNIMQIEKGVLLFICSPKMMLRIFPYD